MAGNKSLLNTNFKDTIKMTLTTDGRLGVGKLSPHFHNKIEATGMIQGRSINPANLFGIASGAGIQVTDGLNNEYLYSGLSTWNGDVVLMLGHTLNFGTNAGAIQVTGGNLAYDGSITSNTPYRLALQPGGGNVAIHHATPIYPLDVNGQIRSNTIIRADSDFTTGTDTPGWIRQNIVSGTDMKSTNSGSGIWVNTNIYSSANQFDTANMYYKVIGKTAFLSFNITNFNNNVGGSANRFAIKLPNALQNVRNVPGPISGPYAGLHHGVEGLAMYRNNTGTQVVECTIRRGASMSVNLETPWVGQWYILISPLTGSSFPNSGSATEVLRGTIVFELN